MALNDFMRDGMQTLFPGKGQKSFEALRKERVGRVTAGVEKALKSKPKDVLGIFDFGL